MEFHIEPASEKDVPVLLDFIKGIAEYERLSHAMVATEESLRETLFGTSPAAEVIIGYAEQEPAGYAVFFQHYSTFAGRPGVYLEDLFVWPEWRRAGLGRQIMGYLARLARERGCGYMQWLVLDWNENALGFYRKLGAAQEQGWLPYRISGEALARLGEIE
jgi:GNAT superfamily N-acetyltransferase